LSTTGSPRRPYDARGRAAAAARNRAAIVGACRELIFEAGFAATTIRAVAERAGVSPETVYKGFGGKPGLMKALWDVTLAGDDAPLTMAERPVLREVWQTTEPVAKLHRYAGFVRGVHQRVADLFAVLTHAGPEIAELVAVTEQERLTGVTAFVDHLASEGLLCADADRRRAADACWVLTGATLFLQLTRERGWSPAAYQDWLAGMLIVTLLDGTPLR
jgi:AcrR family transcriptional regulator